jgi:hypothetical protein
MGAAVILVGIDDTDVVGSRGTNQLAKAMVRRLDNHWRCLRVVRHQLLFDPRVPYTCKNGSASIALEPRGPADLDGLFAACRRLMAEDFAPGSDPGLCVIEHSAQSRVPKEVVQFGMRCKRDLVAKDEALRLASRLGVRLAALGGTGDGVIGAIAAVGLAAGANDGRIVQLGDWSDDLYGVQPTADLQHRGVRLREEGSDATVDCDRVDVGKHLRPNVRDGQAVLFVRRETGSDGMPHYQAVKLP